MSLIPDPFPPGFFSRADETDDALFYGPPRLVTHIDDGAIAAIGELYRELAIDGCVLDIMSSWISHFETPPDELIALGMNEPELQQNGAAASYVVHDLNKQPSLPFDGDSVDDVVCAVSVDYLTQPLDVFRDIARITRPGGRFVCTFSNRLFPTKAIRGWLIASEPERCEIVAAYFDRAGGFGPATIEHRNPYASGDPLYAVWATVT